MKSEFREWLAAERAAGRGGAVLHEAPITRGKPWAFALSLPGNVTGTFTCGLFGGVDASLSSLVPVTEDLGVYDPVTETTLLTLSLAASATDSELPPDSDFNGLAEVVLKLDWTPVGGTADRALGLVIPIIE